ncbi:MAG TPA: LamG domain-containing protein, partial [Polyangiaceae bacterium]|nr:LamG domain-containing protein [Polyangiaceae bacterium]
DASVALPAGLFNNAAGFTVSAWVMLTDNQAGTKLFDFGTDLENHIYVSLNNQSGAMELGVQIKGGTLTTMFTSAMLPLNVWKHVAVMMGANGARLYVDGWEVARSTGLTTAPSALGATTKNWIGKSLGPDPIFAGRIDEFYVYDNPISLAQVRQLAWPKRDYSIWHFDETDGTVAVDSSDFKRDATMVRATFNQGVVGNGAQLYNPNDTNEVPVGADQYAQLPEGVVKDCTQGYTVATWINVIATRSHARVFEFSNNEPAPPPDPHWIFARIKGGSTEQFALGDYSDGAPNSDANYASIAYVWPVNTWHHVAAIRNGQVLHAYIDGQESGPKAPTTLAPTVPPASSLGSTLYNYIGRTKDAAAVNERRRFHGRVDEFLLSCRPYAPEEIKLLATRL